MHKKCFDTIVNVQDDNLEASNKDNVTLIRSLMHELEPVLSRNRDASELHKLLLTNHNIRSLIVAHDTIAQQDFDNDDNLLENLIKKQDQEQSSTDIVEDNNEELSPSLTMQVLQSMPSAWLASERSTMSHWESQLE